MSSTASRVRRPIFVERSSPRLTRSWTVARPIPNSCAASSIDTRRTCGPGADGFIRAAVPSRPVPLAVMLAMSGDTKVLCDSGICHLPCRAAQDVEDCGRGRRDRSGHLDAVGQEHGIGDLGLLNDLSGITGHPSRCSVRRASRAETAARCRNRRTGARASRSAGAGKPTSVRRMNLVAYAGSELARPAFGSLEWSDQLAVARASSFSSDFSMALRVCPAAI
jgi:hypothetical protein